MIHHTKKIFSGFRVFLSWAHDFNCCRINIKEISKFIMQKFRLFQFLSAGCWEQWNVPHDWNWGDTWMWGQTEAWLSPGPSVLSSTAYRYMQSYGALVGIFHQPGSSLEAPLLVLCSVGKNSNWTQLVQDTSVMAADGQWIETGSWSWSLFQLLFIISSCQALLKWSREETKSKRTHQKSGRLSTLLTLSPAGSNKLKHIRDHAWV